MPKPESETTESKIGHPDTRVWIVACALAFDRHALNKYPQPKDIKDAEIAVASLELNGGIRAR